MYRKDQVDLGTLPPQDEIGREVQGDIRWVQLVQAMRDQARRNAREAGNVEPSAKFGDAYHDFRQAPIDNRQVTDTGGPLPFDARMKFLHEGLDPRSYENDELLDDIIQSTYNDPTAMTNPLSKQLGIESIQKGVPITWAQNGGSAVNDDALGMMINSLMNKPSTFEDRFPNPFEDVEMEAPGSGLTPEALIASVLGRGDSNGQ